jgi:BirA family biotin operon repressor/biotin-[acetyl-CoA-carboxylase] ligase
MRFPLLTFAELDSTNSEAARLAAAGERGPLWIVAERQTAGRGRRGRAWQGASGNLAATLLLTTDKAPAEAAQMAFVAALALSDMATAFTPADIVRVKWPNDLIVAGAKAGGVLIETGAVPFPDKALWMAVGLGANLAESPTGTPYPATSLTAHGVTPSREEALEALDAGFANWLAVWDEGGFEPIRAAWTARAHGLGQDCTVAQGDGAVAGINEGLDADGALLLRVGAAVQRITAGDVIFGGA